jgi:uncharacterized RDD family membrane protein YckC
MQCKHCGFANGEDDHRCLRCGRRVRGVVIAAPPGYSGANALAVAPAFDNDTREFLATGTQTLEGETLAGLANARARAGETQDGMPAQTALFRRPLQNVIPFDQLQRQTTGRTGAARAARPAIERGVVVPPPPVQRTAQKKSSRAPVEQGTLDFIPAAPAKNRKLKTDVDAQVFCDSPVATPTHRFVASAIDAAFIFIGFGVTVLSFELMGGSFGAGRMFWTGLGSTLVLVAAFYGLIWAIAGRETAGMRFTDLQLITFDGFPLDGRSRALRFASSWLSFCSGGLGLIWAMADEESLTWHDHISKTFPTIRETPSNFVKQRR